MRPPSVLLSGSGVGVYGPRGDEPVTEETPPGSDFLSHLAREWEAAARTAEGTTRVVLLRTGIVLDRSQGALPQMALPFRLMVGGPVGSGRQYMPWIHVDDWVAMVTWALTSRALTGPLNVTAPEPVSNRTFARALGRALGRPSLMPAPAFAVRMAVGEMADSLLLSGQRAIPAKAQALGFQFQYPQLDAALRQIYRGR
jgi:uncharacterized protein (TIGR01777 family)